MSIRHLDSLFDPASVAVFGATDRPSSVGATVWRNLREGGFAGPRWPVNLKRDTVGGERAYPDVASLPAAPELAVICTPPETVDGLIGELAERGTRAAVVLTAGQTREQKQAMLDAAKRHTLRILGPNCVGLLAPHARLNASFAHVAAQPDGLAFVSQSGALATAVLDWASGRGIGFSYVVSLGERADVDFGDMLDWLASDAHTRAVLLYIESIDEARKFMSAARAAARNKPVLVVKAGRSAQGQAAAASHTGALAGSDLVYDAALRRAGMLRVETLQDLFVAAETLAHLRAFREVTLHVSSDVAVPTSDAGGYTWQRHEHHLVRLERLTLVTNGGGAGVMAADAAAAAGVELAPMPEATRAALDALLPANWSRANPVDIIGDAPVQRYVDTLRTLLAEPECGTLLFMHAPTAIVPSADIARALVPVVKEGGGRVLGCWLGDHAVAQARQIFRDAGIPTYDTPEEAVRAFSFVTQYRRNQHELIQAPASRPAPGARAEADMAAVARLIDTVLADGREMLTEPEAKALLAACGVPVVPTHVVGASGDDAARAADAIGYPVAIKLLSPQITHKSDVGGVALNLEDAAAVRDAAATMLRRVAQRRPDAQVQGFTVQAMVRRARALELIVGAHVDALFGPVVLFGQGGTSVEVVADRAVALPPLNEPLAQALIARTRVARLLAGWRDVPAANQSAVVNVLMSVSQLLADEPRISEIDINPLLADADGVIALDARVRVSAQAPGGAQHFAIRPYPAELEEQLPWRGRTLTLRPIRPDDEAQHLRFLALLDPEDVRMRVFYSRRSIERSELARFTQIDYEREMAFVATAPTPDGGEETLAVMRALCDPDNRDAEFGIVVRSDLKGTGLGHLLMDKMIRHLRARGTRRLVATVLKENEPMLEFARRKGFQPEKTQPDPDTRAIALALQGGA